MAKKFAHAPLLGACAPYFRPREMEISDWHPADIVAALKKRGHSLAGLSIANGYHPTAAGKAWKRPWRAMEVIVAEAVGVAPEAIWPSRYCGAERPILRLPKTPRVWVHHQPFSRYRRAP